MTPPSHFKRIAQDLEKLPCELHEAVLVELEFEQLIRLSTSAGPRLRWSLENSPSLWSTYFKNATMPELQSLLAITDRVKRFCFKLPKRKGERPYIFKYGSLSFLQRRDSDWNRQSFQYPHIHVLSDYEALRSHWLSSLNHLVIDTTWHTFHQGYSRLIKPWIAGIEGATAMFSEIPRVGQLVPDSVQLTHRMRTAFSVNDLAMFVDLYQKLRLTRAEALAAELYRLADIYEAHPTRLKTPFAPQSPRPNEKHIPANLRFEARKLVRRAEDGRWSDKETFKSRFRFAFPALVPYDWTTMLFNRLWQDTTVTVPEDILEKYRIVLGDAPLWVTDMPARTQSEFKDMIRFSVQRAHGTVPPLCRPIVKEVGETYFLHSEQVKWMETFAEVVAWIEERFPPVLENTSIALSRGL